VRLTAITIILTREHVPMTVEFWRMGATPVRVSQIGHLAREFEADGWDGLAVGEAHGILPDPYAALVAAVTQTTSPATKARPCPTSPTRTTIRFAVQWQRCTRRYAPATVL
jgi:alkanesulfonate monooxygenase SsuD/methylene tetrahydromethanopterin reductase-like flavin-dependent oxidoreductase (luciferase family)